VNKVPVFFYSWSWKIKGVQGTDGNWEPELGSKVPPAPILEMLEVSGTPLQDVSKSYPQFQFGFPASCFKQHYVMFVLRDEKRFYTTNVLCFERTGECHMRQIDITKSGVPEAVLKTFSDEIALLYQEEGLKLAAD